MAGRDARKQGKPGIQDIAAAAGVSITTVSHALNDKGRLPQSTRDRVREVAERLGYVAHPIARGLATGRTMLLGIEASGFGAQQLLPDAAYFVDLINGAAEAAFELGFGLVLAPPGLPAEQVHRLAVDGAIVVDPMGEEPLLTALREAEKPVVTTGRVLGERDGRAWVDNDHVAGARMTLDHLEQAGCQRPALLTTTIAPSYVADAANGYRAWCADRGLTPSIARVAGVPTAEAARRVAAKVLDADAPPDALYATIDVLATGALAAADERGFAVPGELAIVALTDSLALRTARPPVTALNLRPARIGRRAVELLVALVEDKPIAERQQLIPIELARRASTARAGTATAVS